MCAERPTENFFFLSLAIVTCAASPPSPLTSRFAFSPPVLQSPLSSTSMAPGECCGAPSRDRFVSCVRVERRGHGGPPRSRSRFPECCMRGRAEGRRREGFGFASVSSLPATEGFLANDWLSFCWMRCQPFSDAGSISKVLRRWDSYFWLASDPSHTWPRNRSRSHSACPSFLGAKLWGNLGALRSEKKKPRCLMCS